MIFDKDLIAVHMKKIKLYINKPVYLDMTIHDLSKSLMYDFRYNYIKTKYGDNAKLIFPDTDSLAYEIKTKDFYKDINLDIEKWFDTSDYPTNHPSAIKTGLNNKVLGMFKDEASEKQIVEFVGLRSNFTLTKCLMALKIENLGGGGVFNSMTIESACLAGRQQHRKMNVIRSHCHQIYTEEINKIALSSDGDKRVIMADGIYTVAYGHTNVKKKLLNMSYNEIPNILIATVVLPNKPLPNLEIIDDGKKLSLYEF